MPKERGYNPVQAQRKAEKAKAIKKGTVTPPNPPHGILIAGVGVLT